MASILNKLETTNVFLKKKGEKKADRRKKIP